MAQKRGKLEIMHDMLEVIRERGGKIKPTHLLYKANLSYQMLSEYLAELLEKELIIEKETKKGNREYFITEKGHNFLSEYEKIQEFMEAFGLE